MRGTQRRFRNGSAISFGHLPEQSQPGTTASGSAKKGAKAVNIPSSGLKVLVIDDSNTIRRSAEIFLKQGGHEVLLAEDGFDALSKVNDYEPDLIFCDILMPRLDGYQTCAIIKRNVKFSSVPIVMLSSKDGVFDKARGRMVGSQDYLTKPFTKDQLLQTVQVLGSAKQG
jgi:twitching motility two-component system response regulator PilG